jgi:hypothetical protein
VVALLADLALYWVHSMFDPNNSRKDVRSEKLGKEEIEKVGRFGSSMRNLGKNSTSR